MPEEVHMRRALELARDHRTHPNPRVGSVLVSSAGDVLGEGAHLGAGEPHAEVVALSTAGADAAGGTLYVTLEPCTHHGRTPPCVDAILEAGVRAVVVGMVDPDEKVSGTGISRLRSAGVDVTTDYLAEEVAALNGAYIHHRLTGLPRVTLKWAMTLDGAVAAADGTSQWISSERAREDSHHLRADADAVVVGAGTVRADNPSLDVRIDRYDGPQPTPVIVAGSGDLPAGAAIWSREPLVFSTRPLPVPSGELIVVEGETMPAPEAVCRALGDRGHLEVLVEGGPTLASAWWRAGVVNRGVVYLSGLIGGGEGRTPMGGVFDTLGSAQIVSITGVRSLGTDYRVDFARG